MTRGHRPAAGGGLAAPLLILVLTVAAFAGVVRNGFVTFDDDLYLTANRELARGPGPDGLRWAFTTTRGGNWHPLTWISHLADARVFGMDPAGHHAVSLAIHAANALLLFTLLRRLTGARWPSALAAALFAVHPLRVESVAWAAERKDVLSTLFALLAALAWLRGVRRPGRPAPLLAAPALFALALLAKPMPLTLPLLLAVLDWWPLGRWSPFPGAGNPSAIRTAPPLPPWREKLPLLALAAASGAVTLAVQAGAGALRATSHVPLAERLANAAVSLSRYLRRTLWPSDLAFFYPYPWDGHPPLAVALAVLALVALAATAYRLRGRRPWLAAGLLWFAVALLPVLGIVQAGEQAMADRYTYLPLAGVFVAASWHLAAFAARGGRQASAAAAAAVATLGLLCAVTARQVAVWRDAETLYARAAAVTESNHVAHNNLGNALLARGQAAAALTHFEATIRFAPGSPKGHLNRGRALARLDRHEEAAASFRDAIARDFADPWAHRNFGQSLEELGRRDDAVAAYREALRLQPGDPGAMDALGVALARAGREEEAVAVLEQAAALAPGDRAVRTHLAVARAQLTSRRSARR